MQGGEDAITLCSSVYLRSADRCIAETLSTSLRSQGRGPMG